MNSKITVIVLMAIHATSLASAQISEAARAVLAENPDLFSRLAENTKEGFLTNITERKAALLKNLNGIEDPKGAEVAGKLEEILEDDPDFFTQWRTYLDNGTFNVSDGQVPEIDPDFVNTLTENIDMVHETFLYRSQNTHVHVEDATEAATNNVNIAYIVLGVIGGLLFFSILFGILICGSSNSNDGRKNNYSRQDRQNQWYYSRRRLPNTPVRHLASQMGNNEIAKIENKTSAVPHPTVPMVDQILAIEHIECYAGLSCLSQIAWCSLGYYLYKRCTQKRKEHKVERLNAIHF